MIEVELITDQLNNKYYYIEGTGILHREDGSAIECANGAKYWYLDGKQINCNSQQEFEKSLEFRSFKLKAFW